MDLLQLESIITTQLKVRVPKLTDNKYPNMSFTNEISDKTPSFPNVYVMELQPSEVGNDLSNNQIHALRDTIQIEVSTNVSKSEAKIVRNACIAAMKAMRFSLVVDTYAKIDNLHRYVIRMRRIVASGDTF
jgi:hypothetical protein